MKINYFKAMHREKNLQIYLDQNIEHYESAEHFFDSFPSSFEVIRTTKKDDLNSNWLNEYAVTYHGSKKVNVPAHLDALSFVLETEFS